MTTCMLSFTCIHTQYCREINVKVYHVGNATTQEVYDKEVRVLFAALDRVCLCFVRPVVVDAIHLYTVILAVGWI